MTFPKKVYGAIDGIGGAQGAMDRAEIDGNVLNDLDIMLYNNLGTFSPYTLDDDSAAAESFPDVVSPDTNPGNKRWILNGISVATGVFTSNLTINGSQVMFYREVNSGNPEFHIGASTLEEMVIQTVYDSGTQNLNYVQFTTSVVSGVADKGEYRFVVDDGSIVFVIDEFFLNNFL